MAAYVRLAGFYCNSGVAGSEDAGLYGRNHNACPDPGEHND